MQQTRIFGMALAVAALIAATGCASSSSKAILQESTRITKGQELNDLIRAKQVGALTDDEFESLRRTIMKRPN
jgi:ribosomal protein S13|nr:hypothetical protein [uncultured Undibacterium sp.]